MPLIFMNLKKILITFLTIILLALLATQIYLFFFHNQNSKISDRYVDEILVSNSNLRALAIEKTKDCTAQDKDCEVFKLYKYVVENYKYYSDPRQGEYIQPVNETLASKGGDCEDLTILLNSLLENAGIQSYFVLTPSHSFTLACGINITKMSEYIIEDLTRNQSVKRNEQVSIKENYYYFLGNDREQLDYNMTNTIKIISSQPIEVFIVDSKEEYEKAIENKNFTHYTQFYAPLTKRYEKTFVSDKNFGIMLYNENSETADTEIEIKKELTYYATPIENLTVSTFEIENKTCITLEPTTGENGYPGYTEEIYENMTAIDPVTKKEVILSPARLPAYLSN
jgi:hypothetical protein